MLSLIPIPSNITSIKGNKNLVLPFQHSGNDHGDYGVKRLTLTRHSLIRVIITIEVVIHL